MDLNPIRCDQCIKLHGFCDRTLPSCQVCIERKIKCTYLTKSKNKKWLDQLKGGLVRFKQQDQVKPVRKRKPKPNKSKLSRSEPKDKIKIIKLPNGYDWENTPLGIMNRFPKRVLLENLMILVQYPSPYKLSNGLSLFLVLTDKLKIFEKRQKINPSNIVQRPKIILLNELIIEAIHNFFIYINSVSPLFIEEGFDFFSKPLILRTAIIISGSLWCKKSKSSTYLIDFLSDKIWEKLSHPHNLKPSLEIIQTLLIIIIGFRHTPKTSILTNDFLVYCNRFSSALGLNLTCKNLKNRRALEKELTYSCLNYLNHYANLLFDMNTDSPTKVQILSNRYTELFSRLQLNIGFLKDFNISSKIILGSFHCDISLAFFSLRILKSQFVYSNTPLKELEMTLTSMLKKIEQIEIHYFSTCNQLYNITKYKLFSNHSKYILITCNYIRYFIHTLYLYHPEFTMDQDALQSNPKFKIIINKALASCKIIIQSSAAIPPQYQLSIGVPNLSQCIIFMIRHKIYSNSDLDSIIKKGKQYLKDLTEFLSLKYLSSFNLYFINTIEESIISN